MCVADVPNYLLCFKTGTILSCPVQSTINPVDGIFQPQDTSLVNLAMPTQTTLPTGTVYRETQSHLQSYQKDLSIRIIIPLLSPHTDIADMGRYLFFFFFTIFLFHGHRIALDWILSDFCTWWMFISWNHLYSATWCAWISDSSCLLGHELFPM